MAEILRHLEQLGKKAERSRLRPAIKKEAEKLTAWLETNPQSDVHAKKIDNDIIISCFNLINGQQTFQLNLLDQNSGLFEGPFLTVTVKKGRVLRVGGIPLINKSGQIYHLHQFSYQGGDRYQSGYSISDNAARLLIQTGITALPTLNPFPSHINQEEAALGILKLMNARIANLQHYTNVIIGASI